MKISSPAFQANALIPSKYTCDGPNINPPLKFEEVPSNAASLALIVDDPDAPAGIWVHWLLWNIDAKTQNIAENSVPNSSVQGKNDFDENSFGGPCPPSGTHHYAFKLYALDSMLSLPPSTNKSGLEKAMKGHILAEAQLIGTYSKK